MICCNSAFEQGNLDLWRYINAFIIIIIIIIIIILIFENASWVGMVQGANHITNLSGSD